MKNWTTFDMAALRAAYARMAPNGHWFEKGAMQFLRSRLHGPAYVGSGGAYFVTSERWFDNVAPRRYSVRGWRGGRIEIVGEFRRHGALADARRAAKAAAAEPLVLPMRRISSELVQLASGTVFAVPKEASCE